MLFNLIGPLVLTDDQELLRKIFRPVISDWTEKRISVELEFEDRSVFSEKSRQPTSIDMILRKNDGTIGSMIEFKFRETEFGGCSVLSNGNCDGLNPAKHFDYCYLHFIGRKYWSLLDKYGFLDGPMSDGRLCILSVYYQFFRILLFALEYDVPMIFIWDDRNPTFFRVGPDGIRGLIPTLEFYIPHKLRDRLILITVKDIVEKIKKSGRHDWIKEFEKKYGY